MEREEIIVALEETQKRVASSDGTQIALIYGGQVATKAANGGNIQTVTSAADPQPHYPSWSPKGDRLVYERQLGSQHDLDRRSRERRHDASGDEPFGRYDAQLESMMMDC